jgi:hypothetical protein
LNQPDPHPFQPLPPCLPPQDQLELQLGATPDKQVHREPLPLLVQLLMDLGQLSGRSSAGVLPTLVGNNVRNRWQQDMTQLEQGGGERQGEAGGWLAGQLRVLPWPGGCAGMVASHILALLVLQQPVCLLALHACCRHL